MTHRALLVEVWGPGYADDVQALRTHIARLRAKIEPDGRRGVPRFDRHRSRASGTASPGSDGSGFDRRPVAGAPERTWSKPVTALGGIAGAFLVVHGVAS